MGMYLDIARKAVDDYRRSQQEGRVAEGREQIVRIEETAPRYHLDDLKGDDAISGSTVESLSPCPPNIERDAVEGAGRAATQKLAEGGETSFDIREQSALVKQDINEEYVEPESQPAERQAKMEKIVLQHYSDRLKGEAESLDKLINDLEEWNPHFIAKRHVIEEAVRGATQRLAEQENPSAVTTEFPVHQRPHEIVDEQVEASEADVDRSGVEADIKEAYDPESVSGGSSEEQPAIFDSHGDGRFDQDQIMQVADVLRLHRDRLTYDVRDLLDEGFFYDKLDFEPTPFVIEEAQCILLLPEE